MFPENPDETFLFCPDEAIAAAWPDPDLPMVLERILLMRLSRMWAARLDPRFL
jgi:hypothetical protein